MALAERPRERNQSADKRGGEKKNARRSSCPQYEKPSTTAEALAQRLQQWDEKPSTMAKTLTQRLQRWKWLDKNMEAHTLGRILHWLRVKAVLALTPRQVLEELQQEFDMDLLSSSLTGKQSWLSPEESARLLEKTLRARD